MLRLFLSGDATMRATIRNYVRFLFMLPLLAVSVGAQQKHAAAPADEWRQFRGTPSLTGVSSSAVPATLKVLWTYELGDITQRDSFKVHLRTAVGERFGASTVREIYFPQFVIQ